MGRFVLIANDAERVQISTQYSCVIAVFTLTSIAVGQLLNSLAQTLFPIKLKSRPPDSLVMAACNFYHARSAKLR
jgi:hypothetical protein